MLCSLLGPFAWSMGNRVLEQIDSSRINDTNRGVVNAGRICGVILSLLLALVVILSIALRIKAAADASG